MHRIIEHGLMKHFPIHAWKLTRGTLGKLQSVRLLIVVSFQLSSSSPPLVRVSPFQNVLDALVPAILSLQKKTLSKISKLFGWGHGAFDNTLIDPWWHIVDKSSLNTVSWPYVVKSS